MLSITCEDSLPALTCKINEPFYYSTHMTAVTMLMQAYVKVTPTVHIFIFTILRKRTESIC